MFYGKVFNYENIYNLVLVCALMEKKTQMFIKGSEVAKLFIDYSMYSTCTCIKHTSCM